MMPEAEEESWWLVYAPLHVHTVMHLTDPTGRHSLTPDAIRSRYRAEIRNSALVVWQQGTLFGLLAGIDELTWEYDAIQSIELHYTTPCKGLGYITLMVYARESARIAALSTDPFEATILEWHRALLSLLETILPGKTSVTNGGIDA